MSNSRYRLFYILIILQLFLNLVFVSIEIYKSKLSQPLTGSSEITRSQFAELDTLTNYATFFEVSFLIFIIFYLFMTFMREYKDLLVGTFIMQAITLAFLFLLNYGLALAFDAPVGNMTLLLYAPIMVVLGVMIFIIFKQIYGFLFRKRSDVQ